MDLTAAWTYTQLGSSLFFEVDSAKFNIFKSLGGGKYYQKSIVKKISISYYIKKM